MEKKSRANWHLLWGFPKVCLPVHQKTPMNSQDKYAVLHSRLLSLPHNCIQWLAHGVSSNVEASPGPSPTARSTPPPSPVTLWVSAPVLISSWGSAVILLTHTSEQESLAPRPSFHCPQSDSRSCSWRMPGTLFLLCPLADSYLSSTSLSRLGFPYSLEQVKSLRFMPIPGSLS